MNKITISYKRHLAKTISYRLVSTTIGFVVMWLATGSFKIGAAFGIAELLYKPIQYYIHERVWYKWIKFGIIKDSEKNKNKFIPTENKIETHIEETNSEIIKTEDSPSPKPTPSSEPTIKKVLNYNSNR